MDQSVGHSCSIDTKLFESALPTDRLLGQDLVHGGRGFHQIESKFSIFDLVKWIFLSFDMQNFSLFSLNQVYTFICVGQKLPTPVEMGGMFSARSTASVPHTVQCRDRGRLTPIPGVDHKSQDYITSQGVVRISPIDHATPTGLRDLFVQTFQIRVKPTHFRICYFGPNEEIMEIMETSNIKELIETPNIRFLFTYSTGEESLLDEH